MGLKSLHKHGITCMEMKISAVKRQFKLSNGKWKCVKDEKKVV